MFIQSRPRTREARHRANVCSSGKRTPQYRGIFTNLVKRSIERLDVGCPQARRGTRGGSVKDVPVTLTSMRGHPASPHPRRATDAGDTRRQVPDHLRSGADAFEHDALARRSAR
jgi:hypothetical protein